LALTAVVTIEVESSPLVNMTLSLEATASTTWPPVTLVCDVFVKSVGMNIDVLVNAEAG
jgi:hypothetical protein